MAVPTALGSVECPTSPAIGKPFRRFAATQPFWTANQIPARRSPVSRTRCCSPHRTTASSAAVPARPGAGRSELDDRAEVVGDERDALSDVLDVHRTAN